MTPDLKTLSTAVAGLTVAQRRAFEATGVVRIPGAIPAADIEAMADRLWSALAARFGIRRDAPQTWTKERPAQLGDLRRDKVFNAMASPAVVAALDDFFGPGGWDRPNCWGGPLVTFPVASPPWDLPDLAWHLDFHGEQRPAPMPNYLRVFTFLAPVEPRGGGTAYVSGSYRVVVDLAAHAGPDAAVRSADMREVLKLREPWFAALCSKADQDDRVRRFMEEGAVVRGVEVRVEEMTGAPGDVVLMHPATLHTLTPNRRDTPRLMLVEGIAAKAG